MINPSQPEESASVPFPGLENVQFVPSKINYRPNSNYILLDYERQTVSGGIVIPGRAAGLDWVTAHVLAKGPDCKLVNVGDKVVLATKGIVGGHDGMMVEGQRLHFTQENMVVSVLETAPDDASAPDKTLPAVH